MSKHKVVEEVSQEVQSDIEDFVAEAALVEDTPVEATPVEAAPVEAAPVEAAPVEVKSKRNAPPREKRFPDTYIVRLLSDKDGKKYGPDNNPKKPNSASADRFKLYVDGGSIEDQLKAGIVRGDVYNDVDRGYISITPGAVDSVETAAEASAEAAAEASAEEKEPVLVESED
jgi:hypothetical protein